MTADLLLMQFIDIDGEVLNLSKVKKIVNLSDDANDRVEVHWDDDLIETYEGPDATAILQRTELIVTATSSLIAAIQAVARQTGVQS
jgi:hypothetical protein